MVDYTSTAQHSHVITLPSHTHRDGCSVCSARALRERVHAGSPVGLGVHMGHELLGKHSSSVDVEGALSNALKNENLNMQLLVCHVSSCDMIGYDAM